MQVRHDFYIDINFSKARMALIMAYLFIDIFGRQAPKFTFLWSITPPSYLAIK
jgi:hypothetical protein